jgi:hypothetical protein
MNWLCLLAVRRELPRVWGRFDHQQPADGMSQTLVVVGMAILVALIFLIWLRANRRERREFQSDSSARLFRELCRAHNLNRADRRLLKRLAVSSGLASQALLFVEPQHFDSANLPRGLQASGNDLQRLRERLFGAIR